MKLWVYRTPSLVLTESVPICNWPEGEECRQSPWWNHSKISHVYVSYMPLTGWRLKASLTQRSRREKTRKRHHNTQKFGEFETLRYLVSLSKWVQLCCHLTYIGIPLTNLRDDLRLRMIKPAKLPKLPTLVDICDFCPYFAHSAS